MKFKKSRNLNFNIFFFLRLRLFSLSFENEANPRRQQASKSANQKDLGRRGSSRCPLSPSCVILVHLETMQLPFVAFLPPSWFHRHYVVLILLNSCLMASIISSFTLCSSFTTSSNISCFMRSKSKVSMATSLLLLAGFILTESAN